MLLSAGHRGRLYRSFVPNSTRYPCANCTSVFGQKRSLLTHLRYECGQPPRFKCPYCDLISKKTSNIQKHIRRKHEGNAVYVQDIYLLPNLTVWTTRLQSSRFSFTRLLFSFFRRSWTRSFSFFFSFFLFVFSPPCRIVDLYSLARYCCRATFSPIEALLYRLTLCAAMVILGHRSVGNSRRDFIRHSDRCGNSNDDNIYVVIF